MRFPCTGRTRAIVGAWLDMPGGAPGHGVQPCHEGAPVLVHGSRRGVPRQRRHRLGAGRAPPERAFGRLVHVSSSEVYGTAREVTMAEDHPLLAETSYAAGKAAADLLLASYVRHVRARRNNRTAVQQLRPSRRTTQRSPRIVPLTIKRLAEGESPVIEGDGLQTRDFIFVQDTVDAILRLAVLDAAPGLILNVGSGRRLPYARSSTRCAGSRVYRRGRVRAGPCCGRSPTSGGRAAGRGSDRAGGDDRPQVGSGAHMRLAREPGRVGADVPSRGRAWSSTTSATISVGSSIPGS